MKEYRITLAGREIGITAFEAADPPIGLVRGRVQFTIPGSPYVLFRDYCLAHEIPWDQESEKAELIDTWRIPELRVFRKDGMEIAGEKGGASFRGSKEKGYEITVVFIPFPFYGEEFPHHTKGYPKWKT